MSLHYTVLDPHETIFTHVLPNGRNVNIASERLRAWTISAPGLAWVTTPVEPSRAAKLLSDGMVDLARATELAQKVGFEPIIYCKDGEFTNGRPDALLADGHHRYVAAVLRRLRYISAYVLELDQWEPFRIDGLDDLDETQLAKLPIAHYGAKQARTGT